MSNVATRTARDGVASWSIHSRMPRVGIVVAPCCRADSRVFAVVIENACVGPPTTTRSMSSGIAAGASTADTTSTCPPTPVAAALAIASVLPQIESYPTSARMVGLHS